MGIKFSNQNILGDDNGYLAHILPNEIFFPICDHLTTADISRLAQSCRHINRRVNEYLNYRVTDQMIGHWQQVCSDHRDLLSPDEQLLAQTELVENKHLSLFLSVYANIHGEDIRRYSTSEHSTPQPSLNTTPCISMYGTQYQTMEDQTVSREVVFIDITKWLFFHFHAEVEPYQTYEVSVMMKLEKNFNWPHRSDQVTDWIIVQDVKQPTCISVDRTWWRNIHKNRPVPDIDGLRVVKEAKGEYISLSLSNTMTMTMKICRMDSCNFAPCSDQPQKGDTSENDRQGPQSEERRHQD